MPRGRETSADSAARFVEKYQRRVGREIAERQFSSDEGQLYRHGLKRCSACRETKSLDDFFAAARYADLLHCQCKSCQTAGIRAAEKRRRAEREAEGKCWRCEWPATVGKLCGVHALQESRRHQRRGSTR